MLSPQQRMSEMLLLHWLLAISRKHNIVGNSINGAFQLMHSFSAELRSASDDKQDADYAFSLVN